MYPELANAFLRWALLHAALARGWWLVAAVYLVVVAELSPSELILIGVFQGITVVVAEVPAGVIADAVSRRLALVLSHVVMGAGMAMTGFVTAFPALVVSNCLWGLGWALSSGADVAWITDELGRPDLIDRVLAAQARRGLVGTVVGIVASGALAWAVTLSAAIVVAGGGMVILGLRLVARWPETNFNPANRDRRWSEWLALLRSGTALARTDPVILAVLAATLVVNGAAAGFGRLFERRLIVLGMPKDPSPIVWFAAVALLAAALGATTLRIVESRIDVNSVARRGYVVACAVGFVGLLIFAQAPSVEAAVAGSLLVSGIGLPTTRVAGTILVNRRTSSEMRTTVHSFLSQAENLGEILLGLALAYVAATTSSPVALTVSAGLLACGGAIVARLRD